MHVDIAAGCTWAPQILHPINISKPAWREKENKTQDFLLAEGALTTELWLPHSHPGSSLQLSKGDRQPIPKLMLKESTGIIKPPSIEHLHIHLWLYIDPELY